MIALLTSLLTFAARRLSHLYSSIGRFPGFPKYLLAILIAATPGAWVAANEASIPPILVVGDSLSAEYGLRRGSGWVALFGARLQKEKRPFQVINASISGETTAGGRSRIDDLLKQHKPGWVLIELGGNDALRGLDLAGTESNLRYMVQASRKAKARVVLIGMMVPPNYGKTYGKQFAGLFEKVATTEQAVLVPFLLEGLADRLDLFQADRIHPTEAAQQRMLDNVWSVTGPLLKTP